MHRTIGMSGRARPFAALLAAFAALVLAPPASAAPTPSLTVTGISAGQTVSGTASLGISTRDAVDEVKWFVDSVEVGWDGASPWEAAWDSTKVADGSHTLIAKAVVQNGAWGTSPAVTFTVANAAPTTASAVQVTYPTGGATVAGSVNLAAGAPSGTTQLKWYVDGREAGWDGAAPWQSAWNSTSVADGSHTIFAKAMASDGSWSTSPSLSFTVANAGAGAGGGGDGGTTVSSKWRLLASDDFNGTTIDTTKWRVYGPNWPGHAGNGLRDGRAVSIGNGMLTITAQMINGVLVSGGVKSLYDRTYGRFEFRVRTDPDPSQATSGCVLTWPQSENWPAEGENNIYETTTWNRYPFSSFVHYSAQNRQYWFHHYADGTQWHTMAMEWEPDQIRIYRDGALVWTVSDTYAIPDWPHHVVMQLDALKSSMSGAVRLQVDYMRIWERAW